MAKIFEMPKLGMDMEEGTVNEWLKNIGDTVEKGEALVEIESDKASVTVESPESGKLLKTYLAEGEDCPCGQPIAFIGNDGDEIPEIGKEAPAEKAEEAAAPAESNSADSYGDIDFFLMPKLGMDMEEGTVNKWLKNIGDTVEKGEALVDIESDKASVTVESPKSGKLLKVYLAEGEDCPCGQPIAYIGNDGDKFPETLSAAPEKKEEAAPEKKAAPAAAPAPAPVSAPAKTPAPAEIVRPGGKLRATPRARRFAEKNGVDLTRVAGTGPNGRIVEEDVKSALANGFAGGYGTRTVRAKQETVEPFTGVRKFIANRMKQSLGEGAQTNTRMDIDMSNVVSFRQQLNAKFEEKGIKISYLDIIVAACAKALVLHPQANCALMEDGIHYKNYANVGVAVDSDKGLVVPVIKDADVLSLVDIHNQSAALVKKAREGSLTPDDMSGGTFTVSNLGMFEVDSFTAIVNPPETCILAVSRIRDTVVAVNGKPEVRPVMNICLSYDHRVIDGAPSAKFLREVKHYLENPVWLLADNL